MAERMAADHECARLRTSLDGADEQARVHHGKLICKLIFFFFWVRMSDIG